MEKGLLIELLINIIADLLACAELYLFMNKILLMKADKRVYRWIIAGGIVVGGNVIKLFIPQIDMLLIILDTVAVGACFIGKFKDILIRSIFAMFSLFGINVIANSLVRIVEALLVRRLSTNTVVSNYLWGIAVTGIGALVIVCLGIYLRRITQYVRWIHSLHNSIYVLMTFLVFTTSAVSSIMEIFVMYCPDEFAFFSAIVQLALSVAVYGVCIGLAHIDYKRQCYEMDSLIKDKYLQDSHDYFSRLKWQIEEVRRVKHDMNAHYFALDNYLKNNDLKSAQDYLDEIRDHQLVAYNAYFTVGNELVDAVIYGIISRYDDISLSTEGIIGSTNIRDYDLCTIFSNLVQNAAEALHNTDINEKVVNISIRHYQEKILISISNRCENNIDITNIGNFTTKKEKHIHGFGISNVRRTLDDYDGELDFTIEDNVFHANISLNDGA